MKEAREARPLADMELSSTCEFVRWRIAELVLVYPCNTSCLENFCVYLLCGEEFYAIVKCNTRLRNVVSNRLARVQAHANTVLYPGVDTGCVHYRRHVYRTYATTQ